MDIEYFKKPVNMTPLRRPKLAKITANPSSVMSNFKTTSLNATLKFVKNDSELALQYPYATTEQADFITHMISQCMSQDGAPATGFKGLYDPLAEALKIFGLKYDFKLSTKSMGHMKQLRFEKTPLHIKNEEIIDLDSSSSSNCDSVKNIRKLKNYRHLIGLMEKLSKSFQDESIGRINNFIKDDSMFTKTFGNLNTDQMIFLTYWDVFTKRTEIVKLFDIKCQMVLDDIRNNVKRISKLYKIRHETGGFSPNKRSITFTKIPVVKRRLQKAIISDDPVVLIPGEVATVAEDFISLSGSGVSSSKLKQNDYATHCKKKVQSFFNETRSLSKIWIKTSLTKLMKFIQDPYEASLIFSHVTNPQLMFLTKWQKMLSKPEVVETYHPDIQVILKEIHRVVFQNALDFRVTFTFKCLGKKVNLWDITFEKVPIYLNKSMVNEILSKTSDNTEANSDIMEATLDNQEATSYKQEATSYKQEATSYKQEATSYKQKAITDNSNEPKGGKTIEETPVKTEATAVGMRKITSTNYLNSQLPKAISSDIKEEVSKESGCKIKGNEIIEGLPVKTEPTTPDMSDSGISSSGSKQRDDIKSLSSSGSKQRDDIKSLSSSGSKQRDDIKSLSSSSSKKEDQIENLSSDSSKQKDQVDNLSLDGSKQEDQVENLSSSDSKQNGHVNEFKNISETWLNSTMNRLKNFVEEQSEASLTFPNVTSAQMQFLGEWQEMMSDPATAGDFPSIQLVSKEIQELIHQNAFDISVAIMKTYVNKCHVWDVTYKKSSKTLSAKSNSTGNVQAKSKTPNGVKKDVPVNKMSTTAPGIPKVGSSTSLPISKARPCKKKHLKSVIKKLPNATMKLIEGLSQPLVSEKGLKMMRIMGWDGGALGLRGEGIVEPLMPALDMGKSKAGLGSSKAPSRQPAVAVTANLPVDITQVRLPYAPARRETRTGVLQTIIKMLEGRRTATELIFPNAVCKQIWCFIGRSVSMFNNRVQGDIQPASLNHYHQSIMKLISETDLILTACWDISKMKILLLLTKNAYKLANIDSKDWCALVNFDEASEAKNDDDNTAAAMTYPFRYLVLEKILEFCLKTDDIINKSSSQSKIFDDIVLNGGITQKQMSYVRDLITRLNNKSRNCSESNYENKLFKEIKAKIQMFTLDVDFPIERTKKHKNDLPLHKIIRIHKKYNTQPVTGIGNIDIRSVDAINKTVLSGNPSETVNMEALDESAQVTKTAEPGKSKDKVATKLLQNNDISTSCTPEYVGSKRDRINEENKMTEQQYIKCFYSKYESMEVVRDTDSQMSYENQQPITNNEKEIHRPIETGIGKEKDRPMVIDIDKENGRPIVNDNVKEYDIPIANVNDKRNDGLIVTLSDKEHDKNEIAATSNKEMDIVAESEKSNELSIVTENANEMMIATENGMPITVKETAQNNTDIVNDVNENHLKSAEDISLNILIKSEKQLLEALSTQVDRSEIGQEECTINKDLGKRVRTTTTTPERLHKKCKYSDYVMHVSIIPKDYPQNRITNKMAAQVQKSILETIDKSYAQELPLLKCHGIQDGGLNYSCHSVKSLFLIEKLVSSLDLRIQIGENEEIKRFKMAFRINSFVEETYETIIKRIAFYNQELCTDEWKFVKREQCSDFVVIHVEIDYNSYMYICNENFTLFAGIDVASFSIVWA